MAGDREYEVTLIERDGPQHRDGIRYVTRIRRPRKRDAVSTFRGSALVVIDVRAVSDGR